MSDREWAYLSVVQWPREIDEDGAVALLSEATGLSEYEARLVVRRGVPGVVARVEAAGARRAVETLRDAGAMAFAPLQHQLADVPEAKRLKSLVPAIGSPEPMYSGEVWRSDEIAALRPSRISLIVHGRVERSTTRTTTSQGGSGKVLAGFALGGVVGAAIGAAMSRGSSSSSTTSRVTAVMDIHTLDRERFRIESTGFDFGVLGSERTPGNSENHAKVALRLAKEAPKALIDTSFKDFRCPPEIAVEQATFAATSGVRTRDEAPAFDFYSAWILLMYRSVLGQGV